MRHDDSPIVKHYSIRLLIIRYYRDKHFRTMPLNPSQAQSASPDTHMIRLATAVLFMAGFASLAAAADVTPVASPTKPNVIVFLSDDVGWAEFGFQGCKDISTPNIDSIASSGVKFTNGYVAATV